MIFLYILIISVILILTKLIILLIVKKHGKFSYDGFSAAGFEYDSKKDIFYSTKNAWQKNFGYTHLYDVLAPTLRMIVDTEPIKFKYNNKNWLITFWKGQYGIVTGAEIGIYCTKDNKANKKTIYLPANDKEMLNMNFTLYKKDKELTNIKSKHWWLAVFKLGMFSKPKELSMDINMTFPNKEMLESFIKSFKKLGYKEKDYKIIDNTFSFKYKKPKTKKVWTRTWISDLIRQHFNKKNVELYNKYLSDFIEDNKIDDSKIKNNNLIMINELIPDLLKNNLEENEISKNIINEKEKNIIFLNSNVTPGTIYETK